MFALVLRALPFVLHPSGCLPGSVTDAPEHPGMTSAMRLSMLAKPYPMRMATLTLLLTASSLEFERPRPVPSRMAPRLLRTAERHRWQQAQATRSSKALVWRARGLAHVTASTRTPCSGHSTLAGAYSRWHLDWPQSHARHRRVAAWAWHAHLLPHSGHPWPSLAQGLTPTTTTVSAKTIPSPDQFPRTLSTVSRRMFSMTSWSVPHSGTLNPVTLTLASFWTVAELGSQRLQPKGGLTCNSLPKSAS